jgi:hypothetical protein
VVHAPIGTIASESIARCTEYSGNITSAGRSPAPDWKYLSIVSR